MEKVTTNMDINPDGLQAFITATKKASNRGDYIQAEKLLKSSLKRVEQQMVTVECALTEIITSLLDVYQAQGKDAEASALQARFKQLSRNKKDEFLTAISDRRSN